MSCFVQKTSAGCSIGAPGTYRQQGMLLSVMKSRSANGRLRLFSLACGLSVTALTCGVALATPAMAAAISSYSPPPTPVLSTSPGGACSTAGPAVVGNGSVTLQAAVSDSSVAGSGSLLGVVFTAYANGRSRDTFASNPGMTVDTPSGHYRRPDAQPGRPAERRQQVRPRRRGVHHVDGPRDSRGQRGPISPPSHLASCTFTFDDATPSAPSLWDDSGYTTACDSLSGRRSASPSPYTRPAPAATKATVPLSYSYSLNAGSPVTVAAGTASPHAAALSVTPSSTYNVLTVTAVGPGGNVSPGNDLRLRRRPACPGGRPGPDR